LIGKYDPLVVVAQAQRDRMFPRACPAARASVSLSVT
jgi:hypothetical protein